MYFTFFLNIFLCEIFNERSYQEGCIQEEPIQQQSGKVVLVCRYHVTSHKQLCNATCSQTCARTPMLCIPFTALTPHLMRNDFSWPYNFEQCAGSWIYCTESFWVLRLILVAKNARHRSAYSLTLWKASTDFLEKGKKPGRVQISHPIFKYFAK